LCNYLAYVIAQLEILKMQSSTLNIKTRCDCEGIIPYVSLSIDR